MYKDILLNRLNRNIAFFSLLLMGVVIILFMGCNKKDRLSNSTYVFSINPPAARVVNSQSKTLTSQALSPGGGVIVNPTWSVSDSSIGTLNTTIGSSVIFQAIKLGDVTITATHDGLMATANLAVVTYIPGKDTFDIYTDNGLPSGADVDSDIFTSAGLSIAERETGYTAEEIKYQRTTDAVTGNFWGVTMDTDSSGNRKNLTQFSGGTLKLAIRLGRVVGAGEVIDINVEGGGAGLSVTLAAMNGFDRTSLDYQEITIPLSSYGGLDLTSVNVPFAIALTTLTSALTFDIDAVRWER